MSDNEVAIVVLSIIFGSIVAIVAISKLFGVLKAWIERNNSSYDEAAFDKLAKAFIKYKKESERRFQNLEAIVTDEESTSAPPSQRKLNQSHSHQTIEIENKNSDTEKQTGKKSDSGNLRNMLKE